MKKTTICLLVSLGIASLLLFLENKPFYQILDLKLYDLQMNLRKPPVQDERILFVEMDDKTIDTLGRWPWPRSTFANIIDTLTSLNARQILFDVTFTKPTHMIVDKKNIPFVFEGKQAIDTYIEDEILTWKGNQTATQAQVLYTLDQIRNGFQKFTGAAEQKLQNALIDNDKVLANSFKTSNAFIGYSFEVLTEQDDIQKYLTLPQIKETIADWTKQHPQEPFDRLPAALSKNADLKKSELNKLFLHEKIRPLIEDNIEITLNTVSDQIGKNPNEIKKDFNSVKGELIAKKISSALTADPQIGIIPITHQYEIFDPATQKLFMEAYPTVKNDFTLKSKFGRPLPENQDFLYARHMEAPIERFTRVVNGGGFLNGIPDQDGVLRFVPTFIQYENQIFPHIAIASALDLYKPNKISFDSGKHLILHGAHVGTKIKDVYIPIDEQGTMRINWTGRWQDTFARKSGAEIHRLYFLRDELLHADSSRADTLKKQIEEKEKELKEAVKGRICILGLTATGTHDFNPIPYESAYPMVGTHGNVLNSILTEQFISRSKKTTNLSILIVLAIIIGLSLPFLSSLHGLFFTGIILTGTFLTSLYLFNQGIWINLASPLLLSLFSYLGITSYKFSTEEKSKREIKNAFSKYVSPDIIEELIQDPSKLKLGGDRKVLTVLFSDIRGFTTYSEKRKPEEIVTILNEYLDAMTKVIVDHKGTLDKYVGDEIMAVFGAPRYEPPEISSQRAVICAMKMLESLKNLHEKWHNEGLEPLDIGIGINTGEMITGNMGSELRMDYTVIGDAVNLGARVEALTRQFNAHLIITEATYEHVKDIIESKPLEPIKVKGKEIPVMIYEVLSLRSETIQQSV